MNITGLSTLNWNTGDKESLVKMRFCSKCDHIVIDTPDHDIQCPVCGNHDFGTPVNVHNFVRMDEVRSNDKKEEAVLDDKSDDRENQFYATSKHLSLIHI